MIAALFLLFLSALPIHSTDEELLSILAGISEEECLEHVRFLAGPGCQGRATPSQGLDAAAEYVIGELRAYGLEGAGEDGSFKLPYELEVLGAAPGTEFVWSPGGKEKGEDEQERRLRLGADFVPFLGSRPSKAEGEPLFVGYGIDARSERWNDIPRDRVRGKIVFAFTREPRADDPGSRTFDGAEPTRYSGVGAKVRAAAHAGAAGLVLVPDPLGFPATEGPLAGISPTSVPPGFEAKHLIALFGWPEIPVAMCSRAVAEEIFGEDLLEYQKSIDQKNRPRHLEAARGSRVRLAVKWEEQKVPAYNVAARLRGSGDGSQVVVLGAHLDHVGFNLLDPNDPKLVIHPGADDNASGSAALLEAAEALAGTRPECDVLFLWFTGEEVGLLGSRAYCRAPLYPMADTVVMLNMDMVGRGVTRKANIGGLWSRPHWRKLVIEQLRRIESELELDLEQGRDLYARSDQYSFHQQGVPGLFFFEADLDDNLVYHRPGDVPAGIDGAKMRRIARLFTATAYAVANEGERPGA